jgi:hypothetical protein
MKASNYHQILKARGYKVRELSEYAGYNVFEKEHLYNKIVCTVVKDSHGKANTITFNIYSTLRIPKDMEELKEAEFDRSYLYKEAVAIRDAFVKLQEMKAPKHLYCF